jgi:hypothetical protein
MPQRKKLKLEIVYQKSKNPAGGVRALNPADGTVEFSLAWDDVGRFRTIQGFGHLPMFEKSDSNTKLTSQCRAGFLPSGPRENGSSTQFCDHT